MRPRRNPGRERGLLRGILANAGLEDLAEDDGIDKLGLHARLLKRAADGVRAQVGGGQCSKPAQQLAKGGARGAHDDDIGILQGHKASQEESVRI